MIRLPYQSLTKGLLLSSLLAIVGCEGSVAKNNSTGPVKAKNLTTENSADEPMPTVQSEPFGQTEDGRDGGEVEHEMRIPLESRPDPRPRSGT